MSTELPELPELLGHRVRPALVLAACGVLAAAVALVATTSAPWWTVALGVVGPDLAFLVALGDRPEEPGLMPRRAVPAYNALHRPAVAIAAAALGVAVASPTVVAVGVAWLAHVVWDRSVGYGLRDARGASRRSLGVHVATD